MQMQIKHDSKDHYPKFYANMDDVYNDYPEYRDRFAKQRYDIDKAIVLVAEKHTQALDILIFRSVQYSGEIFILAKGVTLDTYLIVPEMIILDCVDKTYQRIFDVAGFKVMLLITTHRSPNAPVKLECYNLTEF
jgi:hypothetical protein